MFSLFSPNVKSGKCDNRHRPVGYRSFRLLIDPQALWASVVIDNEDGEKFLDIESCIDVGSIHIDKIAGIWGYKIRISFFTSSPELSDIEDGPDIRSIRKLARLDKELQHANELLEVARKKGTF